MIVCHCEQVPDRAIKHAISDGARTIDDLAAACGAGRNCFGCHEELQALLAKMERRAERVPRWRRHLVSRPA
jgi:bacterioferritin-associated ferredoxin